MRNLRDDFQDLYVILHDHHWTMLDQLMGNWLILPTIHHLKKEETEISVLVKAEDNIYDAVYSCDICICVSYVYSHVGFGVARVGGQAIGWHQWQHFGWAQCAW